jgi:hypothetical protein
MDYKSLLAQSFGEGVVEPAPPRPERKDLAERLDELFSMNGRAEKPSNWLNGAAFASQDQLRANPDWVSQAAHSLREILYPLLSPELGGGRDSLRVSLKNYGAAQDLDTSLDKMGRMYGKLCDIAHHGKRIEEVEEKNFETLLASFEGVMADALERQFDVHEEIDKLFS